ncbi:MAG: glutaredoxin family protein [Eggerthellaceae bacterium]
MIDLRKYTLYYKPTCPFCIKVLAYTSAHDISLTLKNTTDMAVRNELISIGGKGQVPCLVKDEQALYESDDIIAFLSKISEEK